MFGLTPYRRGRDRLSRRSDIGDFFEEMFDNSFFKPLESLAEDSRMFKVDVKETDEAYMIEADLPGVEKENVAIEYENNYLTISAKREDELKEERQNFIRQERHRGEVRRSFFIDNVDEENINAKFKDGVLKIQLNKIDKGNNKRKIEIE
ncbi:Hsp20/alpha crystallin family protein [Clostridiisalibacter paucivorans]|uniref:Hsp20/alpha crystallin family protein n=1 Tax=Clostridiisalibacter paucivorans TaxID=408753 RepID=UPI00047A56E5|nr:Hsp20/alpha crystallin family protein [Clostridiisalibacter paucivorans]